MSGKKLDPSNQISTVKFLTSIKTASAVLENSHLLLSSSYDYGTNVLNGVLRRNNLSVKELSKQRGKIAKVMEICNESTSPISDKVKTKIQEANSIIERRISLLENVDYNAREMYLVVYEQTVDDNQGIELSDDFWAKDEDDKKKELSDVIESITVEKPLTIKSLRTMCNLVYEGVIPTDFIEQVGNMIRSKIEETAAYQCNDRYLYDIPINTAVHALKENLKMLYQDDYKSFVTESTTFTNTIYNIGSIFNKSREGIQTALETEGISPLVSNSFTMNPFNMNGITPTGSGVRLMSTILSNIACSEDDEELVENVLAFSRLEYLFNHNDYALLTEGNGLATARKASVAINNTTTKTIEKGTNFAKDVGEIKDTTFDGMNKFVKATMDKIKATDKEDRRQVIVKGGIIPKLKRYIRKGLVGGFMLTAAPTIGAISLFAFLATEGYLNDKTKKEILAELESELAIVNEKIDDSKGEDKKKEKYELMRIKAKLEAEIRRIKYNLSY